MFVALIVFSFPHGLAAKRDIRERSEVQHVSPHPLITASSVKHSGGGRKGCGEEGRRATWQWRPNDTSGTKTTTTRQRWLRDDNVVLQVVEVKLVSV